MKYAIVLLLLLLGLSVLLAFPKTAYEVEYVNIVPIKKQSLLVRYFKNPCKSESSGYSCFGCGERSCLYERKEK